MVTKEQIEQHHKSIKGSLRFERDKAGYTQHELASEISVNQTTISSWEGRDGSISLEHAWRIADVYGIPLDQLAGRTR